MARSAPGIPREGRFAPLAPLSLGERGCVPLRFAKWAGGAFNWSAVRWQIDMYMLGGAPGRL